MTTRQRRPQARIGIERNVVSQKERQARTGGLEQEARRRRRTRTEYERTLSEPKSLEEHVEENGETTGRCHEIEARHATSWGQEKRKQSQLMRRRLNGSRTGAEKEENSR
ncbi:hypothetical protein CVT26_006535 [Gymnopilus dilepis]|uniref:Uncharacterized protein n=1 Tax=Gymnopilus dilepis TaxID=231916 RepID=A0A409Y387_9AGAR|nr:hypothetical protein CVT26_006535 [Gymnopilus dilepis]